MLILFTLVFAIILMVNPNKITKQPHVIIILVDDMGFNDIGFHGSEQIPTPNIDALAAYGITLNRFYTAPMCTPSRASLLTGKYPSHIGMQHHVIVSDEPWGLGLENQILPQYLKSVGYATHLIGKWHLGFYQQKYTPIKRGFDSHFGYLGAYVDYFNYSLTRTAIPDFESGLDWRCNLNVSMSNENKYASYVLTDVAVQTIQQHNRDDPLFLLLSTLAPHSANSFDLNQAPIDVIEKFNYIYDLDRRKYAAMVSILDDNIGQVIEALQQREMLENSIIWFMSDNGAPTTGENKNFGSNFPLRGIKDSPWEGGVRVPAAVWSPLFTNQQRTINHLFHISDILPTLSHICGFNITESVRLDGHDQWEILTNRNAESPRNDVLINIDKDIPYSVYLHNEWKLIKGTTYNGTYDNWYGQLNLNERHISFNQYGKSVMESVVGQILSQYSVAKLSIEEINEFRKGNQINCTEIEMNTEFKCNPIEEASCLFNIIDDPCEQKNLASVNRDQLNKMEKYLELYYQSTVTPRNKPGDPRSNPKYFNHTWTWWYDELGLDDDGHNGNSMEYAIQYFWLMFSGSFLIFWNYYLNN